MHQNAQRVVDAAEELGLHVELREFPEGTRTAEDAARAIGCDVGQGYLFSRPIAADEAARLIAAHESGSPLRAVIRQHREQH